ncbi:MAG: DUF4340 domain-containing protein [Deltaproteobacteria bacterium]|nr:MAG: DUF4340 domain-containing protein [Deltaproteobacteria bacterium]
MALALVALAVVATRKQEDTRPAGLTLSGYATEQQLDAEKQRPLMSGPEDIANPIDEVILERADGKVRMVRTGAGDAVAWTLTEPVDAPAVKYLVDKILTLFKTKTESVYATRVKEGDLPLYDLEPERRVGLTLRWHEGRTDQDAPPAGEGAVYNGVDLWIGRTEKGDDAVNRGAEADVDTWVMVKSDPTVVYRIGGKDLRTPVEEKLDNLRDKKVFTVKPDALREVSVTGPDGRRFVLTGAPVDAAPSDDGQPPKPASVAWALSEPAGVTADASASAVARSFASLRAKAFVPAAKAPATALSGEVWKITARTADGAALELTVQDGGKDDVWARVTGRDELMKLAAYTADGVRKTLEDVQDKKVLDVAPEEVTAVTFQGAEGPVEVTRDGAAWGFTSPALPYQADLSTLLPSLAKASCARWARPDEIAAARAALTATGGIRASLATAAGVTPIAFSPKMTEEPYDGRRWGVVGDPATAAPFLAQDFVATRFEATPDKLRQKKLFGGRDKSELRRIVVTLPGVAEPVVYESPAAGGEPVLTQVPEGKAANDVAVRTVVATAAALAAKSFSDASPKDVGLEGDGVTRVTLGWADGATSTVSISAKLDGTDAYATVDGGPLAGSVFTLNSYQANNLKKGLDELVK